jgi:Excalibur calcium-binding domain
MTVAWAGRASEVAVTTHRTSRISVRAAMPERELDVCTEGARRGRAYVAAMKKMIVAAAALSLAPVPMSAEAAKPKRYRNCTALHRDYPHGVGRKGARDHVRGSTRPVRDFTRNTRVYNLNDGGFREHDLDRDNDGVACEQH